MNDIQDPILFAVKLKKAEKHAILPNTESS